MEHLNPRREAFQKHPSFDFASKPYIILNNSQFTAKAAITTINGESSSSYLEHPKNPIHTIQNPNLGLRSTVDSEISIFDATKYFNGIDDPKGHNINENIKKHISNNTASSNPKQSDVSSIPRFSSASSADDGYGMMNFRSRSFRSTPTSYSEASWNSQTGLLSNPPGAAAVSIRNMPDNTTDKTGKNRAGRVLTKLLRGSKCPCSGKKSVQVEESLASESEPGKTLGIPRLNRSNSSGSTSLYSSTRQSSPKLLPPYPITAATASPKAKIQLPRGPPTRDDNFIPRQPKLPSVPTTNPIQNSFQPQTPFTPDRVTISTRSFPDGSSTTSNGFTFPVLNNSNTPTGKRTFNVIRPPLPIPIAVDPPRDSLEIFQPRADTDIIITKPNGQEVKELRVFALPASPRSRRTSYDDEACSEASSDLFEIESFSTNAASYPYRDSLDDPSSTFNVRRFQISNAIESTNNAALRRSLDEDTTAPTEMYAPSEVSVDWSVTTAEGFDRASLTNFSVSASELGYAAMKREVEAVEAARRKGGGEGRSNSSKAGNGVVGTLSLMNCRCEKAVSVGPKPVKCGEENGPASVTWGQVGCRVQAHEKTQSIKRHGQAQAHLINVGNKRK